MTDYSNQYSTYMTGHEHEPSGETYPYGGTKHQGHEQAGCKRDPELATNLPSYDKRSKNTPRLTHLDRPVAQTISEKYSNSTKFAHINRLPFSKNQQGRGATIV